MKRSPVSWCIACGRYAAECRAFRRFKHNARHGICLDCAARIACELQAEAPWPRCGRLGAASADSRASRDVPPGEPWVFPEHRSMAEVIAAERNPTASR